MGHYGIMYIARNDQHPPNVYKIGGSSRDVDERMRELSNETATYGTFEAKASFPVTDWERVESLCHNQLDEYRDEKEFFKAPYNELLEVVRGICEDFRPKPNVEQPRVTSLELEAAKKPRPQHVPPEQTTDHPDKSWFRDKRYWIAPILLAILIALLMG